MNEIEIEISKQFLGNPLAAIQILNQMSISVS
jgi:hypothetical protein